MRTRVRELALERGHHVEVNLGELAAIWRRVSANGEHDADGKGDINVERLERALGGLVDLGLALLERNSAGCGRHEGNRNGIRRNGRIAGGHGKSLAHICANALQAKRA